MRRKIDRAAIAAKRQRMRQLAEQVAALSADQRQTFAERAGAVCTIEGHPLSLHNAMMAMLQCPGVSVVGGYRQWQAAGRQVRAGAHGITIWIPTQRAAASEEGDSEGDADSKPGFRMASVFDIGQTDAAQQQQAA